MRRVVLLAATLFACDSRELLAPLGEVVMVVDTDLPVPRVVSNLRVDTYAADGTWLESRSIARRDPRDWPASFSVQAADDGRERDVLIRLRAHGEAMRDVVGGKRLVVGGRDVTPASEPEPSLAVDRLVLVHLRTGERGRLDVVLRASCAGVVARVEPGAPSSCVEGEGVSERIVASPITSGDLRSPTTSVAGTASEGACTAAALVDASRVCIEGGAFVLGADEVQVVPDPRLPAVPALVARVKTFTMDREEVTVGRFRAAVAKGFLPPEAPGASEGDLGVTVESACAYSSAPRGREDFAMSCVSWAAARAFCTYAGGDLPTEAQWEYAATSAYRSGKTLFPWSDEVPDCARAVYGRLTLANIPGYCETTFGFGPKAIRDASGRYVATGDFSASEVHGLGGGVAEWMRDAPTPYSSACFRAVDGSCEDPRALAHVVRGGSWASPPINVRSTARVAAERATSFIGFRCVYPG